MCHTLLPSSPSHPPSTPSLSVAPLSRAGDAGFLEHLDVAVGFCFRRANQVFCSSRPSSLAAPNAMRVEPHARPLTLLIPFPLPWAPSIPRHAPHALIARPRAVTPQPLSTAPSVLHPAQTLKARTLTAKGTNRILADGGYPWRAHPGNQPMPYPVAFW